MQSEQWPVRSNSHIQRSEFNIQLGNCFLMYFVCWHFDYMQNKSEAEKGLIFFHIWIYNVISSNYVHVIKNLLLSNASYVRCI